MTVIAVQFSGAKRGHKAPHSRRPQQDRFDALRLYTRELYDPSAINAAAIAYRATESRVAEMKAARRGMTGLVVASVFSPGAQRKLGAHLANRKIKHTALQEALGDEQIAVSAGIQSMLGRGQWRDMDVDAELDASYRIMAGVSDPTVTAPPTFEVAQRREEGNRTNDRAWMARVSAIETQFKRSRMWHLTTARSFLG